MMSRSPDVSNTDDRALAFSRTASVMLASGLGLMAILWPHGDQLGLFPWLEMQRQIGSIDRFEPQILFGNVLFVALLGVIAWVGLAPRLRQWCQTPRWPQVMCLAGACMSFWMVCAAGEVLSSHYFGMSLVSTRWPELISLACIVAISCILHDSTSWSARHGTPQRSATFRMARLFLVYVGLCLAIDLLLGVLRNLGVGFRNGFILGAFEGPTATIVIGVMDGLLVLLATVVLFRNGLAIHERVIQSCAATGRCAWCGYDSAHAADRCSECGEELANVPHNPFSLRRCFGLALAFSLACIAIAVVTSIYGIDVRSMMFGSFGENGPIILNILIGEMFSAACAGLLLAPILCSFFGRQGKMESLIAASILVGVVIGFCIAILAESGVNITRWPFAFQFSLGNENLGLFLYFILQPLVNYGPPFIATLIAAFVVRVLSRRFRNIRSDANASPVVADAFEPIGRRMRWLIAIPIVLALWDCTMLPWEESPFESSTRYSAENIHRWFAEGGRTLYVNQWLRQCAMAIGLCIATIWMLRTCWNAPDDDAWKQS